MDEREAETLAAAAPAAPAAAPAAPAPAPAPASAGRLYVVGTPIGNLGDLSPRAVEAFQAADAVCCEDTRVTGKLLAHAGISKPLIRCDENVIARRAPQLVARMAAGETLAFASDAGMPGVSDPGQVLVDAALASGVPVEVVPGPVACVTALVASGIPCEHFFFEGFLPRKAGPRAARLRELSAVPGALLFYESPHRAADTLDAVAAAFPQRQAALCRELTKLHEEVLRAPAPELAQQVRELVRQRGELRGEIVLVVGPPTADELAAIRRTAAAGAATAGATGSVGATSAAGAVSPQTPVADDAQERLRADIMAALDAGEPVGALAKRLSQRYSLRKRAVYDLALELQSSR